MSDAQNINFTIKVNNAKQVQKEIDEKREAILKLWGEMAEGYAKRLCPVKTGLLRNSITFAISGKEPDITTYEDNPKEQHGTYSGTVPGADKGKEEVYIGTNVEYAAYVEYGARGRPAKHYLQNAISQNINTYKQVANNMLKS